MGGGVRLEVPDCLEDLVLAERLDWLEDQGWREELDRWVEQVWLEVPDCLEDLVLAERLD